MDINQILNRLDKVISTGNNSWKACCPAHDDNDPSFYIKLTESGMILMHCFGGCDKLEVLRSLGLEMSDLFPDGPEYHRKKPSKPKVQSMTTPNSYYKTVIDIAKSDAYKKMQSSAKDMQVIQEAMDYFESEKLNNFDSCSNLSEFESKRQQGIKLTPAEMKAERDLWLKQNRR